MLQSTGLQRVRQDLAMNNKPSLIYWVFTEHYFSKWQEHILFTSTDITFAKMDHVLGSKVSTNIKRIEIRVYSLINMQLC